MCQRIDLGNGNFAIVCGLRQRKPKVKLPATLEELKAAGWKHKVSRDCRLCHSPLEFWLMPNGNQMPLEAVIEDGKWVFVSHWATCVFAEKFRKPKVEKTAGQHDLKFE